MLKVVAEFPEAGAGINLDISFDSPSHRGLSTCAFIRGLVNELTLLTPLALVIKQFLVMKGLNSPYNGGLSSYGTVLLIAYLLQIDRRQQSQSSAPDVRNQQKLARSTDLGRLFLTFLDTWGRQFDPRTQAVSIRDLCLPDRNSPALRQHDLDPLVIVDPFNPSNNVGRGCFGIGQVQEAFKVGFVVGCCFFFCLVCSLSLVSPFPNFIYFGTDGFFPHAFVDGMGMGTVVVIGCTADDLR